MKIWTKLHALFRRNKLETEMAEEMRLHVELQTQLNLKAGMGHDEARYAALRQFGNVASIQEQAREGRGWMWLHNFWKDVRLGARSLLKSPGFTLIAVITVALGVGANTAMFSMLNEIMLRRLPYADGDHLDRIYRAIPQDSTGGFSPADYLDLQRKQDGFGEIAGFVYTDMSLSEPGHPAELAPAVRASANFFSTLGVKPQLGRNFRPDEALVGNHRVIIISHRYWLNRFAGKADVIGRTVRVDGEPHEIIGVLPETFNDWRFLGRIDLFRPLGLTKEESADRSSNWMRLLGRRADKLSHAEGAAFIAGFGSQLATAFPAADAQCTWRTVPINDSILGPTEKGILAMLIGLSSFVLLIACSNLANFLLARTMTRAREFAVRSAMGATRLQLLRPLITESLLLALAGGTCAVFVAVWTTDWLTDHSENNNTVFILDWNVLAWALGVSLVTALAFGIAPALYAMRLDINGTLKSGARGATGGRGHQRLQHFLIVGQFALSMVLLAGAALFASGLYDLNHRRFGWDSDHLVAGTILLPAATYPTDEKIAAFQRLALEKLEALPGVASASLSYSMPFFGQSTLRRYVVEGGAVPEPGHEPAAAFNGISPHYFSTVGIHLLAGRSFNEDDTRTSTKVFIINQAMARGLFGDESPLGRRLAQPGRTSLQWGEIVGVVGDTRSVEANPDPVTFQLYQPMTQEPQAANEIAVRTAGVAPSTLVDNIRTTMARLDPDLPVRDLLPADTRIGLVNHDWGVLGVILYALAALGLGLAVLGIYGVIARTVAQRSVEFGIRLALGAQTVDITRIVLNSGVKLALTGSALGVFGAIGITKLIAAGLPGMHPNSVAVLIGATLLLVTVAVLACWLPARRGAKVDPMIALRAE